MNTNDFSKRRFHKGRDGWGRDSYQIPARAVVGSSDTGTWSDSPARSEDVTDEFKRFRRDLRKETGLTVKRARPTPSGNVFMVKRWLVAENDGEWPAVAEFARRWLKDHKNDTRLIHDADLDNVLPAPEPVEATPA
jgi:hypothetical protein